MMSSKEAAHPFYRPLWVRVCLVASLVAWSALEWFHAASFWGIVTAAAAVWAIWTFFVTYDPNAAKDTNAGAGSRTPKSAREPD
ncbi:DUF3329 domain-containing protein [Aurantimonas sp. A2-1-M11]|uniref:DUF3329 domain-containing protein n=1 Tax=Aurantimonas sp. A2-1-M11 TaxID=3113712 RepID=UPI002F941998